MRSDNERAGQVRQVFVPATAYCTYPSLIHYVWLAHLMEAGMQSDIRTLRHVQPTLPNHLLHFPQVETAVQSHPDPSDCFGERADRHNNRAPVTGREVHVCPHGAGPHAR